MSNRWNIPHCLAGTGLCLRDERCVYCGIEFVEKQGASRGTSPSWEHIINDASFINRRNIARSCISCNASKGAKPLLVWLEGEYCRLRGISAATVVPIVQEAIAAAERVSVTAPV